MGRLWTWWRQDLVLAMRNSLMPVLIGLIVVMALMVRFALPKEWAPGESYYYADRTVAKTFEAYLVRDGVKAENFLPDEAALKSKVEKDAYGIGVLFDDGPMNRPRVTIFHSARVGGESLNVLKAALNAVIARAAGGPVPSRAEARFIRPQAMPVPRNLTAVPPLVAFEVLVLGFLFVAVFIFQEKSEGSINAYRVSPGGTATYILAKTLAFMVLGVVYGFGLVTAAMGFPVNYGGLLLLLVLGVNLYTFLGISVAVFFRNISQWFFTGVLLLAVNMAPLVSLVFPMFSPRWLMWLPSYPVIFGLSEALFPSGKSILPLAALLAAENVLAFTLCFVLTRQRLMKEGRP